MAAEPSPLSAASAAADDLETLGLDSSSSSSAAAATASASTDPLLHPPTSRAAAAANHDAFVIDDFLDEEDDFSPAPAPSVARPPPPRPDAAPPVFTKITVSDPKKHAEPSGGGATAGVIPGSGSYFTYLISTRLAGGGGEVRVRRRFRDVVALADRLAAAHRGLFVPARPDKSVLEGQVMQRHDFVSQRCAALQRYLCRLAVHPVVGHSPDLRTFLTEPAAFPAFQGEAPRYWTTTVNAAAPLAQAKAGRHLFGMFKGLKQTVVNGLVATKPPPVEQETDTEFLAHKARFEDLQQQLTTTSQQVFCSIALLLSCETISECIGAFPFVTHPHVK